MPDTKPGIVLDERGFCNACRTKEIKETINWQERRQELDAIVDDIKAQNNPFYDCIVAVSGGKDSWYQAAVLAEEYGLKVLCVTLAAHVPTTEGIDNLNGMIEDLNVDHMKITIKPSVFRKIRQKCFLRQGLRRPESFRPSSLGRHGHEGSAQRQLRAPHQHVPHIDQHRRGGTFTSAQGNRRASLAGCVQPGEL